MKGWGGLKSLLLITTTNQPPALLSFRVEDGETVTESELCSDPGPSVEAEWLLCAYNQPFGVVSRG